MTMPSPSTLRLREARRYTLRLTDVHGKAAPLSGSVAQIAPGGEFELPFAPQSVRYPDKARTSTHATNDGNLQADELGRGIPNVMIAGTFGVNVHANSLGVTLDGRGWQRALETVIGYYFDQQANAARKRTAPLLLEWHDTYKGAHLIVTPQATPRGSEDSSAPYRESYELLLTGLRRTNAPPKARNAKADAGLTNPCPFVTLCRVDGIAREAGCVNARTA